MLHVEVVLRDERSNCSEAKLDQILKTLNKIGGLMVKEFDDLEAEVTETKGIEQSAVVLILGIVEKLKELGDAPTPAQLQALRDSLKVDSDALAAAVAANQPAQPAPVI